MSTSPTPAGAGQIGGLLHSVPPSTATNVRSMTGPNITLLDPVLSDTSSTLAMDTSPFNMSLSSTLRVSTPIATHSTNMSPSSSASSPTDLTPTATPYAPVRKRIDSDQTGPASSAKRRSPPSHIPTAVPHSSSRRPRTTERRERERANQSTSASPVRTAPAQSQTSTGLSHAHMDTYRAQPTSSSLASFMHPQTGMVSELAPFGAVPLSVSQTTRLADENIEEWAMLTELGPVRHSDLTSVGRDRPFGSLPRVLPTSTPAAPAPPAPRVPVPSVARSPTSASAPISTSNPVPGQVTLTASSEANHDVTGSEDWTIRRLRLPTVRAQAQYTLPQPLQEYPPRPQTSQAQAPSDLAATFSSNLFDWTQAPPPRDYRSILEPSQNPQFRTFVRHEPISFTASGPARAAPTERAMASAQPAQPAQPLAATYGYNVTTADRSWPRPVPLAVPRDQPPTPTADPASSARLASTRVPLISEPSAADRRARIVAWQRGVSVEEPPLLAVPLPIANVAVDRRVRVGGDRPRLEEQRWERPSNATSSRVAPTPVPPTLRRPVAYTLPTPTEPAATTPAAPGTDLRSVWETIDSEFDQLSGHVEATNSAINASLESLANIEARAEAQAVILSRLVEHVQAIRHREHEINGAPLGRAHILESQVGPNGIPHHRQNLDSTEGRQLPRPYNHRWQHGHPYHARLANYEDILQSRLDALSTIRQASPLPHARQAGLIPRQQVPSAPSRPNEEAQALDVTATTEPHRTLQSLLREANQRIGRRATFTGSGIEGEEPVQPTRRPLAEQIRTGPSASAHLYARLHRAPRTEIPDTMKMLPEMGSKERAQVVRQIARVVLRMQASNRRALAASTLKRIKYENISHEEIEPDECCAVCQDDYTPDANVVVTACKHMYHASCLDKWLDTPAASTCPMCRRDMSVLAFVLKVTPEGHGTARQLWMDVPTDLPAPRLMF